jgi:replication-associated recombination protein RarA
VENVLAAKYRPRRLAQIIGQDKAVRQVRKLKSIGGHSFFIDGKSGQGKTTLARIIAGAIADNIFVQELDAGGMTCADVRAIENQWRMTGWGKGGRAWIINEAHGLRKDVLRALLVLLEPGNVPNHVAVVFTTTADGLSLFEDGHIDAGPLLSRCTPISLTSQGIAVKFAALVARIASREGLNGQPVSAYVTLANRCKSNCRAMLQEVEAGNMMAPAKQP